MDVQVSVRRASEEDIQLLGVYGTALAEQHRGYDGKRFVVPSEGRRAFEVFFAGELANQDSLILVAEVDRRVAGYAFVRLEPPSLVDLSEEAFWLHDIYVHPEFRSRGVGRALLAGMVNHLRGRGASKLMLSVSPKNPEAEGAFTNAGFRKTMSEMQLDIDPPSA